GVLLNEPRSATCVAITHERYGRAKEEAKSQDEEVVEVVRLPAEAFAELLQTDQDGSLKKAVDQIIEQRRASSRKILQAPVGESLAVQLSQRFGELGLYQGQRLMLIDLDRCTRCDECVHACVNTHADGRSRLFLDGPRFGKYLVPISCRSCLDPVCMIGCPVGSIHRGNNGQIVIEDWCIGCGMCAKQCPYGSI